MQVWLLTRAMKFTFAFKRLPAIEVYCANIYFSFHQMWAMKFNKIYSDLVFFAIFAGFPVRQSAAQGMGDTGREGESTDYLLLIG